jgi:hypothetical protein
MSTKKSHRTREQLLEQREGLASHSLMMQLEDAVLGLEQAGFDEQTIYGFVNCIIKGFITGGEWSPIYLAHVKEILRARQAGEVPAVIIQTGK